MGRLLSSQCCNHSSKELVLWVILGLAILLASPSSAQSDMDRLGSLRTGTWSLNVLTQHLQGAFCFFADESGAVRIEAFVGPAGSRAPTLSPQALDNLIWRQNGGWTVILPGDGSGIINPWDEGWDVMDPDFIVYLQTMLASLAMLEPGDNPEWPAGVRALDTWGLGSSRPSFQIFKQNPRPSILLELAPGKELPGFRQRMVTSGRGRGLSAEIIRIDGEILDQQNPESLETLVLRSSRRPGAFRLCEQRTIPVHYSGQDPFLPLWALGDLLRME